MAASAKIDHVPGHLIEAPHFAAVLRGKVRLNRWNDCKGLGFPLRPIPEFRPTPEELCKPVDYSEEGEASGSHGR